MRRVLIVAFAALLVRAVPGWGHIGIFDSANLPPCTAEQPFAAWLVDATSNALCTNVGGGTVTVLCFCMGGAYHPLVSGSGYSGGQTVTGSSDTDGGIGFNANSVSGSGEPGTDSYMGINETGGLAYFEVKTDTIQYYIGEDAFFVDDGSNHLLHLDLVPTKLGVATLRLGEADVDSTSACLTRDGTQDKIYHDTDCDVTPDAGEHYISDGIESLFVGAHEMATIAGTATPGVVGTLHYYQGLPDSATTEVGGWVPLPVSLRGRSFSIKLLYAESSVGSACNFRVTSEAKAIEAGTSIGTGGTTKTSSIARPSTVTSNLTAYSELDSSFATTASTVALAVSIERLGSDGLDTCTTVLRVLGLQLEIL